MGKYVEGKVYISNESLREMFTLFDYVQKRGDEEIKKEVRPIMVAAKKTASNLVKSGASHKWPYSWKLKTPRKRNTYAKSLTIRDHSVPLDVFYEIVAKDREYRLSHLLEHSHRVHPFGNKNKTVMTKEVSHMYQAQSEVDKKAPEACERVIKRLFK